MPICRQRNLSPCGLGCHSQIQHTGYLHFLPIHMVQLEVAMKELIWHGTVAQVLKSFNQELWVWPKGYKGGENDFP